MKKTILLLGIFIFFSLPSLAKEYEYNCFGDWNIFTKQTNAFVKTIQNEGFAFKFDLENKKTFGRGEYTSEYEDQEWDYSEIVFQGSEIYAKNVWEDNDNLLIDLNFDFENHTVSLKYVSDKYDKYFLIDCSPNYELLDAIHKITGKDKTIIEQQQATFLKQQKEIAHLQQFINRFGAKATKAKTAILCVSVIPFLKPSLFFTFGTNKAVVATSKLAAPPIKAKSEESTSKL
mgnify:CR=1 FL=1